MTGTSSSSTSTRDLAYVAVFAALIIVFAFVAIPVGAAGVPIVLQNAVVILCGLVLGAKRGTAATLLFLLLGLIGLPVLAGGRSLLAALAGPTVGYIVGYIFSAFVAGAIAYQLGKAKAKSGKMVALAIAGFVALIVQYLSGLIGLMIVSKMSFTAAAAAQVPFLFPDTLKVALMIAIASGVHAAFPDLMRRK